LLGAVRAGEAHEALLLDALRVARRDGGDGRPLLQAGTGAVRHRLGPGLVLEEAVDRHAVLVDDDRAELGVVADRQTGQGRSGFLAGGPRREPRALHALAVGVTGLGVLDKAVHRPAGDGQLLGAVGPGDLAEQGLVDTGGDRRALGGNRGPRLRAVAVAG